MTSVNTMDHSGSIISSLPLESGPAAPLAMPVQDLKAGESWMVLVWHRLRHGRSWSALPARQTSLQKIASRISER